MRFLSRVRGVRSQRELRGRERRSSWRHCMAIHYAHLVMLSDCGILSAGGCADHPRRSRRDLPGRCETGEVRRHLRGPLLLYRAIAGETLRGGCRRAPAYCPVPERHRYDDVPDAAAADDPVAGRRRSRTSGKPPAGSPRAIGTRFSPPTRTRSRHNRPPSATTFLP